MVATIILLAAFEGYWLNKLYHDEYSNLKKEVDVNFRDAMYKLQRRRFETDTNLVDRTIPVALPLSRMDEKQSKKKQMVIYRSMDEVRGDLKNLRADEIEAVNVRTGAAAGYEYRGVPPPGLIDVIIRQKAGLTDTGKLFLKMDSTVVVDQFTREHLKGKTSFFTMRLPASVTTKRRDGLDSARLADLKDSIKKSITLSYWPGTHPGRKKEAEPEGTLQTVHRNKNGTATFNKVVINMDAGHGGKNSSPMIRFLATNKTVNDSIPVKVIDSAYLEELAKTSKKIPYSIIFKKYADGNVKRAETATDSAGHITTSPVFIGFNTPYSYQASFEDAKPFVLKKMSFQIGGSVLLLMFVLISFITLYRNLMAQQRLTVIKNDFISNITHELKTPIATVNVAIEALRNFGGLQSPERTKEYLDISASELQRLSLLVDKVLKLSMFEKQEITLQKEPFDLLKLVEEVMSSMKLQFEKQKAVVELETTGQNFMIDADRVHITSVVYNLLDNALKYSKENPHIGIRLLRQAEYFELRVSDKGIGIAEAYRSKIFEQFFRVPSGNRHNIKGYGLGLSYVNHIVRQHHGFIEVESELDKGSTFIVKIPFAEATEINYDRGRVISKRKIL